MTITVSGGHGGDGSLSFRREKFLPKGGPDGGNGGKGGDVIFKVNPQLITLQDISLKNRYQAENGTHGKGKNMHGKNGKNMIISVPPGTIVRNADTQQVLNDLTRSDDIFRVARGGNGGFGNARFKTQSNPKFIFNQAPKLD